MELQEENNIGEMLARSPITLSLPVGKVDSIKASYSKQIKDVYDALIRGEPRREQCLDGFLIVQFVQPADKEQLSHNPDDKSITLFSTAESKIGTKEDAKLLVQMDAYQWDLPINVTFIENTV